jgi:uncharacterized protein YxeA
MKIILEAIVNIVIVFVLYKLAIDAFSMYLYKEKEATQIQQYHNDYFNKNPRNYLHEAHFVA